MPGREDKIFYPSSLGELHSLIKNDGALPFFSGRMYPELHEQLRSHYDLPGEIISLDRVDELKRISRSETYIDCGSAVSFSALFNKAGHLLPSVMINTVKKAYNPAQLYLTTPAGLLYSGSMPTPVSLLFNVMDVSYEIRRLKTHRWRGISAVNHWVYHNQLFKNGTIDLKEGDIILRMRIPSNTWGHAQIRKIQLGSRPLFLAITAEVNRNYISNFRFSYALDRGEIYRDREREAHISGRTINGSARETEILSKSAAEISGFPGEEKLIRAIYNCIRNFLYQKSETGA